MRLTAAQEAALRDIAVSPGKSGAFFRDLGNPIGTLLALERKGLVRSDSRGYSRTVQWSFWLTPEGQARVGA